MINNSNFSNLPNTKRYKRLREWHVAVFNLKAVKESGISPLDERPSKLGVKAPERLSKSGKKTRKIKAPSSSPKVQGIHTKRLVYSRLCKSQIFTMD